MHHTRPLNEYVLISIQKPFYLIFFTTYINFIRLFRSSVSIFTIFQWLVSTKLTPNYLCCYRKKPIYFFQYCLEIRFAVENIIIDLVLQRCNLWYQTSGFHGFIKMMNSYMILLFFIFNNTNKYSLFTCKQKTNKFFFFGRDSLVTRVLWTNKKKMYSFNLI